MGNGGVGLLRFVVVMGGGGGGGAMTGGDSTGEGGRTTWRWSCVCGWVGGGVLMTLWRSCRGRVEGGVNEDCGAGGVSCGIGCSCDDEDEDKDEDEGCCGSGCCRVG